MRPCSGQGNGARQVVSGIVRNADVPVSVRILDAEPDADASSWDHLTECSLVDGAGGDVDPSQGELIADALRAPGELGQGLGEDPTLHGGVERRGPPGPPSAVLGMQAVRAYCARRPFRA